MRLPEPRVAVPWLIGVSLRVSLVSLVLVISFGVAARTDSIDRAQRRMTAQAEGLTRQIENDMAQFDLVLRDAARLSPSRDDARLSPSRDDARLSPSRDAGTSAPRMSFLDLPLTSHYVEFINVLNEVGDVVADPRSNVSRPVNFAGRDYFQGHLKNPADIVMIGRPFATAPTQHASIPISRRLNRPDGTFAGVVVAGVRLDWLNDLLSHATMIPQAIVTVRRDDGLILIRAPYDLDAIGRSGTTDAAWQRYLRTGRSETTDDPAGIQVFRRLGPLVLELTLDRADLAAEERSWSIWLPTLTLLPALCVLVLGFAARDLLRRGSRIEAASDSASDECMRLLANMSHELRTPLTGIIGQAELLTDEGGLTDRQSERLAIVTEAGRLMRGIVDRVIDIARPDELTAAPLLTPCDLDPLVRACLGVVEGEARRKGILLISTIDPAAPRRAMLDQDRVRQMLINLLMNAVKYTVRGSVALRISGDASHLRFEVADTGPGIPVRKRWRLFRAYDRLDAAASHPKGTGLGLSITQRFTHRMGGQIGYAENPGGGSIFWIELPITEPLAPIAVATENPTPEPSSETRHLSILLPAHRRPPGHRGPGRRIRRRGGPRT